ncbi:MAG: hypothetical protein HYX93_02455 [Chloroflexi bacterium]|nr:hypothetical protein [Chloroflexota bacterium]
MRKGKLGFLILAALMLMAVMPANVALAAHGAFSATAQIVQRNPGIQTLVPDCGLLPVPVLGAVVTGEVFDGTFGVVSGNSVVRGSNVSATQDATLCFIGAPDPSGNVPFVGAVRGVATITKGAKSGSLVAAYGAGVSGTLNLNTGGISVSWIPGTGAWGALAATGNYAGLVGHGGPASATAASAVGPSPEVGSLTISSP